MFNFPIQNYDAIFQKMSDYEEMTKGEVADHLQENHFYAERALKLEKTSSMITAALFATLGIVSIALGIGAGIAMAGKLNWTEIAWSIASGGAAITLAIAGVGAIHLHTLRGEKITGEDLKALKVEIEEGKLGSRTMLYYNAVSPLRIED